jgi:predicted TIM-barrel fold metal-dependent hydrolase
MADSRVGSVREALTPTAGVPVASLEAVAALSMRPSDYFRRHIYSCSWFEREGIRQAIDAIGHQRVLFETDFPYPTCTYPDGLDVAAEALARLDDEVVADLMGDNAARLYGIA